MASRMPAMVSPQRGEIWLVNFDPSVGSEIRKHRPALVVSVSSVGRLPLRLVVPITDWKVQYSAWPWFVQLPSDPATGLSKRSGADTFQTKSVSIIVSSGSSDKLPPSNYRKLQMRSNCALEQPE